MLVVAKWGQHWCHSHLELVILFPVRPLLRKRSSPASPTLIASFSGTVIGALRTPTNHFGGSLRFENFDFYAECILLQSFAIAVCMCFSLDIFPGELFFFQSEGQRIIL